MRLTAAVLLLLAGVTGLVTGTAGGANAATGLGIQIDGFGTVQAGSAPACTSPESNASSTAYSCASIDGATYDQCTATDSYGSSYCTITLTATAGSAGWRFDHWSGSCSGTATTCVLTTEESTCDPAMKPPCSTTPEGPYAPVAVFVDTRAPTLSFYGQNGDNNVVVYSDEQVAYLSFHSDEDGESPAYLCQQDRGAYAPCSPNYAWWPVPDGVHDFCAQGTDPSGNVGAPLCRHWETETYPTATLLTHPDGTTSTPEAAFTYTSNKASHAADGSRLWYQCSLDQAPFTACPAAGKSYSLLTNGTHEMRVQVFFQPALDPATTKTATATDSWTQSDTTGPTVAVADSPDGGVHLTDTRSLALSWTGSEPSEQQTFRCELDGDGTAFQPCESPLTLNGLADGLHELRLQGRDFLGNDGPLTVVHWDQEVPAVASILTGPAAGATVAGGSARFGFGSNKATPAFQCALDGHAYARCSAVTVLSGLADGRHTLSVRGTFTSPLTGTAFPGIPVTRSWRTVNPPNTRALSSKIVQRKHLARFSFAATGRTTGFQCRLTPRHHAASFKACSSPRTYRGLRAGRYVFQVRAIGPGGQDSTPARRHFRIR